MVPLLKFYFHEEVRQAAVQAVPELLKSVYMAVSEGKASGADMQYVKQMLDYVWAPLIEAMIKVTRLARQQVTCDACLQFICSKADCEKTCVNCSQRKGIHNKTR